MYYKLNTIKHNLKLSSVIENAYRCHPSYNLKRWILDGKRKNKLAASWQNQQCGCAPSEDSDQPEHPPSLIRVFAVRMKKAWALIYPLSAQRRLWSDWADAQADLSLRWAHTVFVGFVTRRLKLTPVHSTTTAVIISVFHVCMLRKHIL